MKSHIVLAHPESQSFNGRLANISHGQIGNCSKDMKVTYSDLYADGFDPREAPVHYEKFSNTEQFHAQTEQRFICRTWHNS